MTRNELILDRYEPLGTAGAGGFGTVRIAWDPRIQRKVAIKTIGLSEADARRAGLPGADAVAGAGAATGGPTADRWHGVQPWDEFLEENWESWEDGAGPEVPPMEAGPDDEPAEPAEPAEPVTSLAHIPGLDEARTAAKLTDSRIVGVYDFEVRGQIAYLIMEYVEGITLTRLLADYEDFLTLDVVAAVFDAVAGALAVAHKAGVLHLDIKPDNILINADGQVKVTDFGLATLADASGTGLAGGGTIGYMPLEQMRREPLDARTDEWSLASVVYEMLTGDNPFRADDLAGAEAAIEDAEIVLPSLCWEDVDEQIDDVVFYALDPDRERRYASVSDFAEELDKFLGDVAAGKRQLAAVVQDALGVFDEDDADADEDAEGARGAARRPGFVRRAAGRFGGWAGERFSGRWPWLVGRVLVAGLVAYLGVFAASHLYATAPLLGQETASAVAVASAVVLAAVAAAWPPAGILVAGVLVGLAFSVANVALVGIALAVGTLVWWYVFWRLDGQGQGQGHPVLLRIAGLVLVALLAALLVFVPVRVDYLPAAVVVVVAIAVSGALL